MIHAGIFDCPIEVNVENHNLIAVSSDGFDFEPVEVASIMTYAGERYDFIINTDQSEGLYWIRFKGYLNCEANSLHQVAVLQYAGTDDDGYPDITPTYDNAHKEGIVSLLVILIIII